MKASKALNISGLDRLRRWLASDEGGAFVGLLLVATFVRFLLSYFLRVSPDLQAYETWGELILRHFFQAYTYGIKASNVWLFPNYPPLTMYLYAIVDLAYFGVAHLLGVHVSHSAQSPVFRPILLIPGMLTDLICICIIYALARAKLSSKVSLLIAATYAFSPAVLIDDVGWGQTDNLGYLIAVGALLLALRHKGLWAGVLMGLAITLKPQPWIFIPLTLLYLYRWAGWREAARGAAAMLVTTLGLWAPYLLPPKPEIFVWQHSAANAIQVAGPVATRNAYNLWWVLGAQHQNINAPYLGPLSAQMIGGALFGASMLLALAGIWLDASPRRLWAGAALLSIAFFDFGTLQYERYIFPAVGFFLLAALYDRRHWWLYGIVSVTAFVCLGATIFTQGYGAVMNMRGVHRLGIILSAPVTTWWVAVVNVVIVLVAAWMVMSPLAPSGHPAAHAKAESSKAMASIPRYVS